MRALNPSFLRHMKADMHVVLRLCLICSPVPQAFLLAILDVPHHASRKAACRSCLQTQVALTVLDHPLTDSGCLPLYWGLRRKIPISCLGTPRKNLRLHAQNNHHSSCVETFVYSVMSISQPSVSQLVQSLVSFYNPQFSSQLFYTMITS